MLRGNCYENITKITIMKPKITKRDIGFCLLGFFTLLLVDIIWNWDESVKAFYEGAEKSMRENHPAQTSNL